MVVMIAANQAHSQPAVSGITRIITH
jgi:hypothetical protein